MNEQNKPAKIRYFIPRYGGYYHFICESAVALYKILKENSILESLDCELFYQGSYDEIVQLFSCRPIVKIPIAGSHLQDASTLGADIRTLQHIRPMRPNEFGDLIPTAQYLSDRVRVEAKQKGITIIKRVEKRIYRETEELAERLKVYGLPVRIVQLENESFQSQVNFMRNSEVLVAPHGAGTVNQIFMPSGGTIVELFPKGDANWHAKAIADVFGHELTDIESELPSVFGLEPSAEIRQSILENGWPDRETVRKSRKHSEDLCRVIRHVESYSIEVERVIEVVEDALRRKNLLA